MAKRYERDLEDKREEARIAARLEADNAERFLYRNVAIDGPFNYTTSPSLAVAPLKNPPIKGGLTDCFNELYKILHRPPGNHEDSFAPPLPVLRRVRGK